MKQRQTERGFTVVEMLITIVVAVIFLQAFYTLFNSFSQADALARNDIEASNFLYSNLQFGIGTGQKTPCINSTNDGGNAALDNDLLTNPNAPGTIVTAANGNPYTSGTTPPAPYNFPGPYTVVGTVYYPKGCGPSGDGTNVPAALIGVMTYGPNSRTVSHATYIK